MVCFVQKWDRSWCQICQARGLEDEQSGDTVSGSRQSFCWVKTFCKGMAQNTTIYCCLIIAETAFTFDFEWTKGDKYYYKHCRKYICLLQGREMLNYSGLYHNFIKRAIVKVFTISFFSSPKHVFKVTKLLTPVKEGMRVYETIWQKYLSVFVRLLWSWCKKKGPYHRNVLWLIIEQTEKSSKQLSKLYVAFNSFTMTELLIWRPWELEMNMG